MLNETVGVPQAFVNISSCNIHQAAVAAICKTGTDVIFATYTFEGENILHVHMSVLNYTLCVI